MSNSRFGTYLENFNKGYDKIVDEAAQAFNERTMTDQANILSNTDGILLQKFQHIQAIFSDTTKSGFNKLSITGDILSDLTKDIMTNANESVKKSGANVIKSYFDTVKKTSNDELLKTAERIARML